MLRVLIRNRRTAQFLAGMNEWVATRDRALDFVGTVMAVQTATRLDLKGVEIVLLSDNSNTEVVVAIPLDQKIRHASGERL